MRRRLYFLLPDVSHTKKMFNHLLLARIEARHIHVLGKEDADLGDLPEATLGQRSDIVHGVGQGVLFGGFTGLLVGIYLFQYPPEGMSFSLGVVLMMSLLGAIFGIWSGSLIGSDVPNTQLKSFRKAISQGKILMMVDVPRSDIAEVTALMKKQHPEARPHGMDPTMPAFP